jgi:hypothetical protein
MKGCWPGQSTWGLDRAVRVLALALVLAGLLNGLPFWMRRVGLIDRTAYAQELATYCRTPLQSWWLPLSCNPYRTLPGEQYEAIDSNRLYQLSPQEKPLKGFKYGVMAGLLLGSFALALSRWSTQMRMRRLLPVVPLLVSLLVSMAISIQADGLMLALSCLPALLWVPLIPLAGWLTPPRRLQILADALAALLLLQLPFVLLESMRGLPMRFGGLPSTWLPGRLAGLLTLPNSLGVLVVVAAAFCTSVSERRWQRWPLQLASLALVLLARSGTGLVALVLLVVGLVGETLRHRLSPRRRRMAVATLVAVGLAVTGGLMTGPQGPRAVPHVLPKVLGRPSLFHSPLGRLKNVGNWVTRPMPRQERLWGYGVTGGGSLAAAVLGNDPGQVKATDAMPLLLLAQGGLLALVSFYGLVLWCLIWDRRSRVFWIVLIVASLTLNVTEVFPLGLLLAVMAARSLGLRPGGDGEEARLGGGIGSDGRQIKGPDRGYGDGEGG